MDPIGPNEAQLLEMVNSYWRIDAWEMISLFIIVPIVLGGLATFGDEILIAILWPFGFIAEVFGCNLGEPGDQLSEHGGLCFGVVLTGVMLVSWGIDAGTESLRKPPSELTAYEKTYAVVASEYGFIRSLPSRIWGLFSKNEQVQPAHVLHAGLFYHAWESRRWSDWITVPLVFLWLAVRCLFGGCLVSAVASTLVRRPNFRYSD